MSTAVFPNGGRSVVEQMCAKFPELYVNEDAKQLQLTTRIQEQFAYQWGGKWGGKKRTGLPDSAKSKDSMAYDEGQGVVSTYDMFQGNEAVTILVYDGQPPTHPDLPPSEATFMPVTARDWLGVQTPGPGPEQPVDDINTKLDAMAAQQAQDTGQIIAVDNYNTERVLQKIDDVKTQMEESLTKVLQLYLLMNRPGAGGGGEQPPEIPGEGGLTELQKAALKYLLQNRPARGAAA